MCRGQAENHLHSVDRLPQSLWIAHIGCDEFGSLGGLAAEPRYPNLRAGRQQLHDQRPPDEAASADHRDALVVHATTREGGSR